MSPPIQPLSVNDHEYNKNNGNNSGIIEEKSLGQIQMLQKSHQLLILVLCIFVCAIVTAVYETWNSLTEKDCITFINGPHTDVINEIFRLIARITWLFIPSWLIIYVFWIWPQRPKKFVSDDSLRRRELKRQQNIEKRNEILNKICCYCFTNNNNSISTYNEFNNVPNDDNDNNNNNNNNNNNHHKSSMYHYDADNRIINDNDNDDDDDDDEEEQIMYNHKSSVVEYHSNDNVNDEDNEQIMYNRQISDDFNESSSSSLESDSMRNSHIWDQHITTENIRPVVTPSVSNVLSGSIAISAKQNINQS